MHILDWMRFLLFANIFQSFDDGFVNFLYWYFPSIVFFRLDEDFLRFWMRIFLRLDEDFLGQMRIFCRLGEDFFQVR